MGKFIVPEAADRLSELIDRALAGETIVITRDGKDIVQLRPVPTLPKMVTAEDLDWLKANRVGTVMPSEDAATLVRRLRDEEHH